MQGFPSTRPQDGRHEQRTTEMTESAGPSRPGNAAGPRSGPRPPRSPWPAWPRPARWPWPCPDPAHDQRVQRLRLHLGQLRLQLRSVPPARSTGSGSTGSSSTGSGAPTGSSSTPVSRAPAPDPALQSSSSSGGLSSGSSPISSSRRQPGHLRRLVMPRPAADAAQTLRAPQAAPRQPVQLARPGHAGPAPGDRPGRPARGPPACSTADLADGGRGLQPVPRRLRDLLAHRAAGAEQSARCWPRPSRWRCGRPG